MPLSLSDQEQLYAELAKLTKAGFGFDRSVVLLEEQALNPRQRAFTQQLREGLERGRTVAQSFAAVQPAPSGLEIALIDAAERGGLLEQGFSFLSSYFSSILRTRRAIRRRLVYPAILLHFAVFLPLIPPLILGTQFGAALRSAIVTLAVLYGLGFGFIAFLRFLRARAIRDPAIDGFLNAIPLTGKARRLIALQRFCQVFRIYLLSGLRVSDGLTAAGEASQSARLREAASALAANATDGQPIASAIRSFPVFPSEFARSLANAETTGSLTEDLERWGESYRFSFEEKMEQVGTWIPKMLYFVVVLYVAWRIVSLYSDMLNGIFDQFDDSF